MKVELVFTAELTFAGGYSGWALYTNADAFTPGAVTGQLQINVSKKKLHQLMVRLDLLEKLDPVTYKFDTDKVSWNWI